MLHYFMHVKNTEWYTKPIALRVYKENTWTLNIVANNKKCWYLSKIFLILLFVRVTMKTRWIFALIFPLTERNISAEILWTMFISLASHCPKYFFHLLLASRFPLTSPSASYPRRLASNERSKAAKWAWLTAAYPKRKDLNTKSAEPAGVIENSGLKLPRTH